MPTIPVIMLSARAGEEARIEGLGAGVDDYLIKPFSARELRARIGMHLETARLRAEASMTLRESESVSREMADHAPVMIWVTDDSEETSSSQIALTKIIRSRARRRDWAKLGEFGSPG